MRRAAEILYAGSLITLPWTGMGVLRLVTGRDWGWGLQPSWLLLGLATALVGAGVQRRGQSRDPGLRSSSAGLPRCWLWGAAAVGAALLLSAAGILGAPSQVPAGEAWARYGKQVIQLGIMGVFVAWPAIWTRGSRRWDSTVRWILVGALIQAAYGFLQAYEYHRPFGLLERLEVIATSNPSIQAGSPELYLDGVLHRIPRLRGTMSEPLYLGHFLLLALPLVAAAPWSGRRRVAVGILLGLLMVGTWSRGAWIALMAGAVAAFWLVRRRGSFSGGGLLAVKRLVLAAGGLVLVGVAAWLAGWDAAALPLERLGQSFNREDWSNLTRLYSMQAAWRAFLLSPVVGIGWGQFGFHFPLLVDPLGLQSQFTWPVVNNFALKVLCETGLVGFGVLVTLGGGLARRAVRIAAGAGGGPAGNHLVALAVANFALGVQLLTFSQYNLPHIWVALGLLLAAVAEDDSPAVEATP